jgi:hypothetical protein
LGTKEVELENQIEWDREVEDVEGSPKNISPAPEQAGGSRRKAAERSVAGARMRERARERRGTGK